MTTHDTKPVEQRGASDSLRALDRALAARRTVTVRRRADVICDELARPQAKDCPCPITSQSTIEQPRALSSGCTAGQRVNRDATEAA